MTTDDLELRMLRAVERYYGRVEDEWRVVIALCADEANDKGAAGGTND